MGERLNDGAGHSRRRARPDDALAGPPELEALLARALCAPDDRLHEGGEGERRAVAAFRAARDAGAAGAARTHRLSNRRRDDWRPRARRHTARSLRVTLCALIAGLALGGAAFAAIGSGTDGDGDGGVAVGIRGGDDGDRGRPRPSAGAATDPPGALVGPSATGDDDRDRPARPEDAEARCRAYEKVRGRRDALDSTAWKRLVTAAGGEQNVEAYCDGADGPGKAGKSALARKTGKTGKTGESNQTSQAGKAGKTGESSQTSQAGKADKAGKSGKGGKSDKAGTGDETDGGGRSIQPDASAQPGRSAEPETSETSEKPGKPSAQPKAEAKGVGVGVGAGAGGGEEG
jgi:hypothetical protein